VVRFSEEIDDDGFFFEVEAGNGSVTPAFIENGSAWQEFFEFIGLFLSNLVILQGGLDFGIHTNPKG
jgi:hypothetical protein